RMLLQQTYVSDKSIAISLFLSIQLKKPLLIEGPAGVGKTEIAKVLAKAMDTNLIRLQCYEGLDAHHALYEWNYQRQLLHLKMLDGSGADSGEQEKIIFSEEFLMERPLLQAIRQDNSPVLLIDEVDRADEEFESFLLELLSDWQITIPEIGTIKANHQPYVILTGNRTRELSEALRRRCLYLWIDYPNFEKELAILKSKVPDCDEQLALQICTFMKELRAMKLEKTPGIAETIDWAQALAALHFEHLDKSVIEDTLGVVLKDWQDMRHVRDSLTELWEKTGVTSRIG
ncbi:MAG: MoxR-like ATPase, partial [Saprospiraceae bacterium]